MSATPISATTIRTFSVNYISSVTVVDLTRRTTRTRSFALMEHLSPVMFIRTFDGLYLVHDGSVRRIDVRSDVPEEIARRLNEAEWSQLTGCDMSATEAERPQEGVYGEFDEQAGF